MFVYIFKRFDSFWLLNLYIIDFFLHSPAHWFESLKISWKGTHILNNISLYNRDIPGKQCKKLSHILDSFLDFHYLKGKCVGEMITCFQTICQRDKISLKWFLLIAYSPADNFSSFPFPIWKDFKNTHTIAIVDSSVQIGSWRFFHFLQIAND